MAVNSLCLVIWTAIVTSRMNAQPLTDRQKLNISDPIFSELCVRTHNYHRSRVTPPASNMMYMTRDETLAKVAQDWASKCIFSHNPSLQIPYKLHPSFRTVGENIWKGSTALFSVENAIQMWVGESKYYSYQTNQCNGCGHYTQVVWAKSYKVGCASNTFITIIKRNPPQPPCQNEKGTPCSSCPGKKCLSNLYPSIHFLILLLLCRVIWGSEPVYTYDPKAENKPGWGTNPSQGR
uniref:GLI pathosis related 1 n=1 Tax=Paramormyrops kingsleyae TaxID=1676925 RepID=A0A3B3RFK2_9TELE